MPLQNGHADHEDDPSPQAGATVGGSASVSHEGTAIGDGLTAYAFAASIEAVAQGRPASGVAGIGPAVATGGAAGFGPQSMATASVGGSGAVSVSASGSVPPATATVGGTAAGSTLPPTLPLVPEASALLAANTDAQLAVSTGVPAEVWVAVRTGTPDWRLEGHLGAFAAQVGISEHALRAYYDAARRRAYTDRGTR